jgi:uncharacterized protein YdhG (YjbR/CyaY superfamily)
MKNKTKGSKATPKTVSDYLANTPDEQRRALERLRRMIRKAVPKGEECICYQMPAFRLGGKFLVSFAAWQNHCAFYPGSLPLRVHKEAVKSYNVDKGTIRFLPENPLPATLVRKLTKTRIEQVAR